MIEIGISNLSKSFGVDKLFENITFDIKTKDKIGLVGRNGVGKTTLMKILAGYEDFQSGSVNKKRGLVIGYLEQIPNYDEDYTVLDVLNTAFVKVNNIKINMEELEKSFNELDDEKLEKAIKKYSELHDLYDALGGYNTKEKLNKILNGLDISIDMQRRHFNTLSGGEKTRVILGKILLEEPELLLLDEPSNHLDIKSVEWLEEYLKNYEKTIVMVSHDRYFLDKVANKIVELQKDSADTYIGNYSKYVSEKELRFLQAMKEYRNQQKKIKKMEEQIQRYRIWGEMRDSDKMYKRAKELEKRLEKIDQMEKPIIDKRVANFKVSSTERTGKEVIKLYDISKYYDSKLIFSNVNFTLYYNDSMCILGENGTGKSTILKIILNEVKSDSGEIKIGSKVKIGYLPQQVSFENENISIVDFFSYNYSISISEAKKELAKILFTNDDVYKQISVLSGGEKSRLKLGMLMYENVNTLILDEPTNHLDIESREVLEENLLNYEGTILFVSHDRYFVQKISTSIAELENKKFKLYNFDYESYRDEKKRVNEKIAIEEVKLEDKKISENKEEYLKRKEEAKEAKKNKKYVENLEISILKHEERLIEIEEILNDNSLQYDLDEYNKIYNEYNSIKEKIEEIYEKLNNI